MITIISGTNRTPSKTILFANHFWELLKELSDEPVHLIDLAALPNDMLREGMYAPAGQAPQLTQLQDELLIPAEKFHFVFPEYNGSFPGILKLFLDAVSIRSYAPTFKAKKAGLVGVASGRAGNLRGIDHMTGVLHHVGTLVMPKILPISSISAILDDKGQINSESAEKAMREMAQALVDF